MNTISFKEVDSGYQADFTANGDYALHIERVKAGKLKIQQRSSNTGNYADCILPTWLSDGERVIDVTLSHGVYPMNVRIISETPVTIAERQEAK